MREFLDDESSDKRTRTIDDLLASDEYVEYWTFRLASLLRLQVLGNDRTAALAYRDWLRSRVAADAPWDETVRELLLAEGDTSLVGPANFTRDSGDARRHAEQAAATFMGVRLQCANCHDHPLDRWKQADYHGLAAIFAPLEREAIVRRATDAAPYSYDGRPATPRIPGERDLPRDSWPYFAFVSAACLLFIFR